MIFGHKNNFFTSTTKSDRSTIKKIQNYKTPMIQIQKIQNLENTICRRKHFVIKKTEIQKKKKYTYVSKLRKHLNLST